MKKLANLKGVKALNKREQKEIFGGGSDWAGFCFPSENKCNYYCTDTCTPCGITSPYGYTPHVCGGGNQI